MHVSVLHVLYVLQTFLNLTNWRFNQPFIAIVHKFYSEKACLSEDLLFCLEHIGDLKFGCTMMVIKKNEWYFLIYFRQCPQEKVRFLLFPTLIFTIKGYESEINKILVDKWINHHYVQSWFSFVLVCKNWRGFMLHSRKKR